MTRLSMIAAAILMISTAAFAQDRAERKFITEAIQGNLAEVQLGELAQKNAESQEVKSFGQMLVTDHNAAKDLAKVTMTAKEMKDNEEALTIYLVPSSADPSTGYAALSGVMRIRWGTVELSAPWTVKQ